MDRPQEVDSRIQTAEAWRELQEAFLELLELAPGERAAAVGAYGPDLRAELASMLGAHDQELDVEAQLLMHHVAPDDQLIGRRLGPWQIRREIGAGGMGTVYLAERHDDYQQQAAIKILRRGLGGQETVERFRRERQILARLEHPNIARLLDGGVSDDGRPYLVMQLIDGEPITRWADSRQLDVDARLALFRTVCDAVDYAHRNLIVHRDLKPSNILARERDGVAEVTLLDFGIAKLLEGDEIQVTRSEMRLMTPEHAAPEQIRGEAVTTATDTYALGLLLYELLAGERPFREESSSRARLESSICQRMPSAPSQVAKEAGDEVTRARRSTAQKLSRRLRGDLDTITARALAKEPDRRYGSARELAEDIERHLDGRPVLARPDSMAYRLGRFVGRHTWQVSAGAIIALLLVAFSVTTLRQSKALERERDEARGEREAAEQVADVLVELVELASPYKTPGGKRFTVDELLEHHSATVIDRLDDQPPLQSRVRHMLGRMHRAHSRFGAARELFEEALAQRREFAGPDDELAMTILHDLGVVAKFEGDRAKAEKLLRQSLADHRRIYGEVHAKVAQCLQDLASVLSTTGSERQALLEESLEIRRQLEPEPGIMTASSLNDLALMDMWNGRLDDGIAKLREVSVLVGRLKGPEHPYTLTSLGNLGAVLSRAGRFAEAAEIERDIVDRKIATLGLESMEVIRSLNNLGNSLANLGDHEGSERQLRLALETSLQLFGEHHEDTVNAARNLARVVELQGRPREAAEILDRAEAAEIERGPFEEPFFANQRAALESYFGRADEAIRQLTSTLDELDAAFPERNYRHAQTLALRGEALAVAGDFEASAADYRDMLAWYEAQGQETPMIPYARCGLARALSEIGEVDEARKLFETCLEPISRWGLVNPGTRAAIELAGARVLDSSR